jgi:hypothetical protein
MLIPAAATAAGCGGGGSGGGSEPLDCCTTALAGVLEECDL